MNRNFSIVKSIVSTAALAAGVSVWHVPTTAARINSSATRMPTSMAATCRGLATRSTTNSPGMAPGQSGWAIGASIPGIVVWGASAAITGAVGNQCAALTN
jgi:hypothetical protein